MKRIVAILLAAAACLCFVACTTGDDQPPAETPAESESLNPSDSGEAGSKRDPLPYRAELLEAEIFNLERDFLKFKDTMPTWFNEKAEKLDPTATRYYGIFGGGYIIIFVHEGWDLDFECSFEVAGESFSHSELFSIYAYKGGIFYELSEAYEREYLELAEIMLIADIHAEFEEYIKKYS